MGGAGGGYSGQDSTFTHKKTNLLWLVESIILSQSPD
jgi:hypothetical protein